MKSPSLPLLAVLLLGACGAESVGGSASVSTTTTAADPCDGVALPADATEYLAAFSAPVEVNGVVEELLFLANSDNSCSSYTEPDCHPSGLGWSVLVGPFPAEVGLHEAVKDLDECYYHDPLDCGNGSGGCCGIERVDIEILAVSDTCFAGTYAFLAEMPILIVPEIKNGYFLAPRCDAQP